jgi:uncharacterized protein YuzE
VKRRILRAHRVKLENVPIQGFEFDPEAEAIYLSIADGEVDHTKRISDSLLIDVDKKGNPLGIEILRVKGFKGLITPVLKMLTRNYPIKELLQTA